MEKPARVFGARAEGFGHCPPESWALLQLWVVKDPKMSEFHRKKRKKNYECAWEGRRKAGKRSGCCF